MSSFLKRSATFCNTHIIHYMLACVNSTDCHANRCGCHYCSFSRHAALLRSRHARVWFSLAIGFLQRTLMFQDMFYLRHERVTKKMTIMVSPTFRRKHLQREIVKGSVADRSWRSATDPFTYYFSRKKVFTPKRRRYHYCHLFRRLFVS